MFDPKYLSEFIQHIMAALEKQQSYTVASPLNESEIAELKKHFDIKMGKEFGNLPSYIFTKKCQN